jgi:hypothetical protein
MVSLYALSFLCLHEERPWINTRGFCTVLVKTGKIGDNPEDRYEPVIHLAESVLLLVPVFEKKRGGMPWIRLAQTCGIKDFSAGGHKRN